MMIGNPFPNNAWLTYAEATARWGKATSPKQVEYILATPAALSDHPAVKALVAAERDAWREEPESSEAWCAGNQHVLDRLCVVAGADPAAVQWDGSDGCLNEETDALIWRILRHNDDDDGLSPREKALVAADADLLLDAYKALLVLHRVLDKEGLMRGAETAKNIADRIIAAHPEIPVRAALRAEAATIRKETT